MNMNHVESILMFIGGLGMFLYGMETMADGLQKVAGNKMKQMLGILTNNKLLAVIVGAGITGIIHSSTATTVMVVGFVNAGMMNLMQATGVIMGANIGTTITAWIVAMGEWTKFLQPEYIAPIAIGIGAFMMMACSKERQKNFAMIAVGFGLLFIGLTFMSNSVIPYRDAPIFADAFRIMGSNPFLGVLAGTIVTAIIQSSTASVGILQTLAANGLITWSSGVYIILGQNLGTCLTAIFSSFGTSKTAKRAAAIHFLFNLVGVIFIAVLAIPYFYFFNKVLASTSMNMTDISIFHTVFNIINVVIVYPFPKLLIAWSEKIIRGDDDVDETESQIALRHLDERILGSPAFAVDNAIKEVVHMGRIAIENTKRATNALISRDMEKANKVIRVEKDINEMEKLITEYLVKISNSSLNEKQHKIINDLFYTISDIERVGDHAENLAEFAQYYINNNLEFSEIAQKELIEIVSITLDTIEYAITARETENINLVRKVVQNEEIVDNLKDELREKHIKRLSQNVCDTTTGIVFLDVISNLERISDHALNIAYYVKDEV